MSPIVVSFTAKVLTPLGSCMIKNGTWLLFFSSGNDPCICTQPIQNCTGAIPIVSPNPISSNQLLMIDMNNLEHQNVEQNSYEMVNHLGSVVQSGKLQTDKSNISVSGLHPGLYKLHIRNGTKSSSQTIHIRN